MTTTKPRINRQRDASFDFDYHGKILLVAFMAAGIAAGLWVGYRTGGWMWLIAPAIGLLWGFLLLFGTFIILILSQTTTGGTTGIQTYKVLSIWALAFLAHLGLLGYFAYWALSTV